MSESKIEEVELVISRSLQVGVILSAAIMLTGFIMYLVTGNSGYAGNTFPTSLQVIFAGLLALKPYAIILTGLLILILTPVFRVGISILVFMKEKDYLYVKITAVVFAILIVSFVLGKVE